MDELEFVETDRLVEVEESLLAPLLFVALTLMEVEPLGFVMVLLMVPLAGTATGWPFTVTLVELPLELTELWTFVCTELPPVVVAGSGAVWLEESVESVVWVTDK